MTRQSCHFAEFYNKLNNILDKKLDAVQKSNIVYVTNHTYIDGDEVASRTVSRVDAQMVTDKRKGKVKQGDEDKRNRHQSVQRKTVDRRCAASSIMNNYEVVGGNTPDRT